MNENAKVRADLKWLSDEFVDGANEGFEAEPNSTTEFWARFNKLFKIRERGYIFGRLLQQVEVEEGDKGQ